MNLDRDQNLFISSILLLIILFFQNIQGQASQDNTPEPVMARAFRPSAGIVIGVLSIMFTLTFLLVVYAKFCHTTASRYLHRDHAITNFNRTRSRFSGIDKTAIESLPFFRFSSLKGSKEGLECAVCLSKFEDEELLRLLPKCKHAFHISCVDRWLESHSSCPLCRHKVDPGDQAVFGYSNSFRLSRNQSELSEYPNIELFVQREQDARHGSSSRFSIGSSFRKTEIMRGKKEELLIQDGGVDDSEKVLHKLKHKIIVSDVLSKNRWSDVNSSDLMILNSEMLEIMSSTRFPSLSSCKSEKIMKGGEEMAAGLHKSYSVSGSSFPSTSDVEANLNKSNSTLLGPSGTRSMSEIANVSRFADLSTKASAWEEINVREDKMRRLWFPIAKRTVQWLAGRERR